MISLVLTDSTGSLTLPVLGIPLSIDTLENATDVVTLDYNMYTDFINSKRQWSNTWESLSEAQYEALKGYYDRQFTLFEYPELTIDHFSVADVPVRMYLNTREVWNYCGDVQNVQVIFRESTQLSGAS